MAGFGVTIIVSETRLEQVKRDLEGIKGGLPTAASGAINETLMESRTQIVRGITSRVNIKAKDIRPHIRIVRSTPKTMTGKLTLAETKRLGLKYFGARQTARGVSYRIAKSGGRTMIPSAFGVTIPRLGGQVFLRVGRERLPLRGPLRGPSPWGVVVKSGIDKQAQIDASAAMDKNLGQRVQFLILKSSGSLSRSAA